MLEPHLGGDIGQAGFVIGVAIAVYQHDGRRPQSSSVGRGQLLSGVVLI